jgi:hypothetical protein
MNSKKIDAKHKNRSLLFQSFVFVILISVIASLITAFVEAKLICYAVTFISIVRVWARLIDRPYLTGINTILIISVCSVAILICFFIVSFSIFQLVFSLMLQNMLETRLALVLTIITGTLYWIFAAVLQKYSIK